jgi:glutathione S-transferase
MASKTDQGRRYHEKATGPALVTVEAHVKDAPITLFGSCFCPFVQRVWCALEFYDINYRVSTISRSIVFSCLMCNSIVRLLYRLLLVPS